MPYISSYAAAVPSNKKAEYSALAAQIAQVFKDHGALRVVECWGDEVPVGILTSFPKAVQAGDGETVVIGWQEWPDKATQMAGTETAMKDPRMAIMRDVPLNGKTMIFGNFETLVDI